MDDSELAARLRLAVMRLARRLRTHADELSPTLVSALVTVEQHGPITLGALAAHERVSPPSITRAVAALEKHGLVSRETDPDDRRVARVSLTALGRRTVLRGRKRKTAYLVKRLSGLDEAGRASLSDALPALERLLEDEP
jgi:DNA-binding MarR family transcriptional regulator